MKLQILFVIHKKIVRNDCQSSMKYVIVFLRKLLLKTMTDDFL